MNLEDILETKEYLVGFEKKLADLFYQGKIKGPVHFSNGNEDQTIKIFRGLRDSDYISYVDVGSRQELLAEGKVLVGKNFNIKNVSSGVKKDDWVFASYRSHYHVLLKGIPEDWLINQIVSGNSMHPLNKEYKFITSAIVSGHLPIALGVAKALQLKKSKNQVWAFCGDMAAETGVFHEVSKYAENFDLPITFVIEDNGLSVDTPTEKVWNRYNFNLGNKTMRYVYKSGVPHQGLGKEVGF